MAPSAAMCALAVALVLARLPGASATFGDTFSASLQNNTLPVGYKPVKGNGVLTITEGDPVHNDDNIFFWELDVYDLTHPFTSVQIAKNGTLETILVIADVWNPDDTVYFGNWTREELESALSANGFTIRGLYDSSLTAIMYFDKPPKGALAGPVNADAVADDEFSMIQEAQNATNFADVISNDVQQTFVAQLYNITVHWFKSGFAAGNGTASFLILDYGNDTLGWSLDLQGTDGPQALELRLFETLYYQPPIMRLHPDPKFTNDTHIAIDEDVSYSGNFSYKHLNNSLAQMGYPDINLNTYPPSIFVTLSDVRNETILGFVFNSNAAPAPTPVVKGATNGAAASASTALRGALAAAAAAAALLLM